MGRSKVVAFGPLIAIDHLLRCAYPTLIVRQNDDKIGLLGIAASGGIR